MVVEATSLPDPPRIVFKRRVVRLGVVFVLMAAAIAADAVARSYRYYSQIIDARLASGYLTSRPGLYAAPRVLAADQKLSRQKLVAALRRAGHDRVVLVVAAGERGGEQGEAKDFFLHGNRPFASAASASRGAPVCIDKGRPLDCQRHGGG